MSSEDTNSTLERVLTRPRRPDDPPGRGRVPSKGKTTALVTSLLATGGLGGAVAKDGAALFRRWAGLPAPATVESELRAQHQEDLAALAASADKTAACWRHWNEHLEEVHGL